MAKTLQEYYNLFENKEYNDFVDKFKIKKTTDDCYTPPAFYEFIKDYVVQYYNLQWLNILRPFYPDKDYKKIYYNKNDIVIDNPPFSILKQIIIDYTKNNIKFFLFCNALTSFQLLYNIEGCTLILGDDIVYENGANVYTAFITNLEPENIIRVDNGLIEKIKIFFRKNKKAKNCPQKCKKYVYPENFIKIKDIERLAEDITIKKSDCIFTKYLYRKNLKQIDIFGGGFIVKNDIAKKIKKLREKYSK